VYGALASILVLWVTFAPCFAWIFLGAPFVERLHGKSKLTGALAAVTAAVVGVILNLALWFGLRVLFAEVWLGILALDVPVPGSLDLLALTLAALAAVCVFWLRLGLMPTLGVTAAVGLAAKLALG
jgi:chromate transporter